MSETFHKRDVISINDFSADEILKLCETGRMMYNLEKQGKRYHFNDVCRERALASMFYEPSTRTRTSFTTAIRELGGVTDGSSGAEGTSVMKKETIRDTIMMMGANHFDVIVMRHPLDGSLQWAADVSAIPVINGGDGKNEHPTQALLDVLTLYMLNEQKLDGLKIGFGGDLSHGRTVRSLSLALSHFTDITIRWAADDFLGMPEELRKLLENRGVTVIREETVQEVMAGVDFYYMTRPQLERMGGVSTDKIQDIMDRYRIDTSKINGFDVKILHPLPVNSEIAEIDYDVYFSPAQAFFKQAEFGIFLRKALLFEMLDHTEYECFEETLHGKLESGNNRVPRKKKKREKKEDMFIDRIKVGTVLDHLKVGTRKQVDDVLALEDRGFSCIAATINEKRNPFLKTDLPQLTERDLKKVASISPEPTVNFIRNGQVVEKFVYILCTNENCVTRVINEDVPPQFYNDNGTVRCRYCRRPFRFTTRKLNEAEIDGYKAGLPGEIGPIH